jgi:hypothetical protein
MALPRLYNYPAVLAAADDELGAFYPMQGSRRQQRRALVPSIPGVPQNARRRQPLGGGTVSFILNSGTSLTTTIRPQKPYLIRRVITSIARTGTTATGLVSITRFAIGANDQLVQAASFPADLWSASSADVDVVFDPASVGQDIVVQFAISAAVTGTDSVVVGIGFLGETYG